MMARALDVGFHVHIAEGLADVQDSLDQYGVRVVERLAQRGLLGPKTIAAHCVHVDAHEMDLLKETGTRVVHNPRSNMNSAVGVAGSHCGVAGSHCGVAGSHCGVAGSHCGVAGSHCGVAGSHCGVAGSHCGVAASLVCLPETPTPAEKC